MAMPPPAYAELHCLSDFTFLRGASSAAQLFERARACGYQALAITDECSLAGIVRAFEASRNTGVPLIVGSEFRLVDGTRFVLLVQDQAGYEALCSLITTGRRAAGKGCYRLTREDFTRSGLDLSGLLCLWLPTPHPDEVQADAPDEQQADALDGLRADRMDDEAPARPESGGDRHALERAAWVRRTFTHAWLAVELHRDRDDAAVLRHLLALAQRTGLTPVACGDVHMDLKRRRALQDTLTALRHRRPLTEAGGWLFRNGERHLRRREALAGIYPPALLAETLEIARRCTFRLDSLQYRYPQELVPEGHTPTSWLRHLTEEGLRWRWPQGAPDRVVGLVEHELALIADLGYEPYFLTVHDIVRFARSQGILCQGRGSAANSAVCFVLGIVEVDPSRMQVLVERFISRERNEPPDIDVDFEHERREEVFQYIYGKYGRARAALTANVICYRGRSAARDVARALGFPPDQVTAIGACFGRGGYGDDVTDRLAEAGFDPATPLMQRLLHLVEALHDHPRHLSQHVGGFVISDGPLSRLVPIENAAMPARTIIQWNKDDLDVLGMLKVDCLALGMLTCVRKTLALLARHRGRHLTPATIPPDDAATYDMISAADTVGVFQIESRAQMSMLPRLRPRCFYDLVIQVAIVRPGPIQGDMVHPYLRRRQGLEPVNYPSEALREVFERTLGVPLFQEQAMKLAIVAAGYTPGEADHLRRSMAAWRRHGDLEIHRQRLVGGMQERGYSLAFAERIFEQLKGFANYGFPESHACAFALITYVSCWLKRHEPAAFICALLNSQPMGFYSASSLLQDARRHGVTVRPVDVRHSHWDNTLEGGEPGGTQPALRLGFRQVHGLSEAAARRIVAARLARGGTEGPWRAFRDVADLCHRAGLDAREAGLLAEAGALRALTAHRHAAHWAVAGVEEPTPLFAQSPQEQPVDLPLPSVAQELLADYRSQGFSLTTHPLALLRRQLEERCCLESRALQDLPHGRG
ncbi:MAG: error-prone DNA polymerase, partial [Lautropia mirabilis]